MIILGSATASPPLYAPAYRDISAARTLDSTDYQVECTANTFAVTLPSAVGIQKRIYSIKNSGSGIITVTASGAETIDGESTQLLSTNNNITVMSNGTNYIII